MKNTPFDSDGISSLTRRTFVKGAAGTTLAFGIGIQVLQAVPSYTMTGVANCSASIAQAVPGGCWSGGFLYTSCEEFTCAKADTSIVAHYRCTLQRTDASGNPIKVPQTIDEHSGPKKVRFCW